MPVNTAAGLTTGPSLLAEQQPLKPTCAACWWMQTGTCGLPQEQRPQGVQGRGTAAAHPLSQGPSHHSGRLWLSHGAHPTWRLSQSALGSSRQRLFGGFGGGGGG